jgi:hypothetical protein
MTEPIVYVGGPNQNVMILFYYYFFFKLFIMLYNSIKNYKRNSKGK